MALDGNVAKEVDIRDEHHLEKLGCAWGAVLLAAHASPGHLAAAYLQRAVHVRTRPWTARSHGSAACERGLQLTNTLS